MTTATETEQPEAVPILDRAIGMIPRLDEIIAAIIVAYVVVMSFRRLAYGVDWADESFAYAITQRYALGDLPFRDEFNLRQTAGLITTPFYWLYLKVMGGTDGIVYYLRVLYFLLQMGVGYAVYELAEKRIPRAFALVAAVIPVAYIPFSMPCPNYNSLGAMFLALGTFVGLRGFLDGNARTLRWAGIFQALACVAYPPNAVGIFAFGLCTRLHPDRPEAKEKPWAASIQWLIGIAIIAIPFALILAPNVMKGVRSALDYEGQTTRARGWDKAKGLYGAFVHWSPAAPATVVTGIVAWLFGQRVPKAKIYIASVMIAWVSYTFSEALPDMRHIHVLTLHTSVYTGALAIVFIFFLDWKKIGRSVLFTVWIPSAIAGFFSAFASDNGQIMNGGLGLFAACLLCCVIAPMAAETGGPPLELPQRLVGVLAIGFVSLTMVSVNYAWTYSDGAVVPGLDRVRIGPYRSLKAPAAKVQRTEELTRELRAVMPPGGIMLSYYDNPGPYLMVPSRPGVQTVWTDRRARLSLLLPYYKTRVTGQGVAIVINGSAGTCPELERYVEQPDRLLKDGGWYRIFREPSPGE